MDFNADGSIEFGNGPKTSDSGLSLEEAPESVVLVISQNSGIVQKVSELTGATVVVVGSSDDAFDRLSNTKAAAVSLVVIDEAMGATRTLISLAQVKQLIAKAKLPTIVLHGEIEDPSCYLPKAVVSSQVLQALVYAYTKRPEI